MRHFHERDVPASPEVTAALDAAAALLAAEGATILDVTLPPLGEFAAVNRAVMLPEATAIHERWLRERPGDYAAVTRRRFAAGDVSSAAPTTSRRSAAGGS